MRRPPRRWLFRAAVGLALAALAGMLAWRFVARPWLLAEVKRRLETDVSGLIRGRLEVDATSHVSPGLAVFEGVRLFDSRGRLVARGRQVRLSLDPARLLRAGELHFAHGEVLDPEVWLYDSEEYGVTLFEALDAAPDDDTLAETSLTGSLQHLKLRGVRVLGDVPPLHGLATDDLDLDLRLRFEANRLMAEILRARMQLTAPFSRPLEVQRLTGRVEAAEQLRIDLHGGVAMGDDRVRFVAALRTREDGDIGTDIVLRARPVSSETLSALSLPGSEYVRGSFTGRVGIRGSLAHLRYRFDVDTAGGPVRAHGETPVGKTTRWVVHSDGLALHRVLRDLPPSKLRGRFEASLEPPYATAQLSLNAAHASVYGIEARDVRATGTFDGSRLRVRRASLRHAGGHYVGAGWVDLSGDFALDVRARAPEVQRSPLWADSGLRGRGTADLHAARAGEAWDVQGELHIADATLAGVEAHALRLEGQLSGQLERPRLRVHARARDARFRGLSVQRVDLHLRGDGGVYRTRFDADAGPRRHLNSEAELRLEQGGLRIVTGASRLGVGQRRPWLTSADLFVDAHGMQLYQLRLSRRQQRLWGWGYYGFDDGTVQLDARMERFDVEALAELLELDAGDLAGEGEGSLRLSGAAQAPDAELALTIRHARFLGLENLTVIERLTIEDAHLTSTSRIVLPDASALDVEITGEPTQSGGFVERLRTARYRLRSTFDDVDLRVAHPWLGYAGLPTPTGTVRGELGLAGSLQAPTARGELALSDVTWDRLAPMHVQVRFGGDDTRLFVDRLRVADGHGTLFEASAQVRQPLVELTSLGRTLADPQRTPDWRLHVELPRRPLRHLPGDLQRDSDATVQGRLEVGIQDGEPLGQLAAQLRIGRGQGSAACGLPTGVEVGVELAQQETGTAGRAQASLGDGTRLSVVELESEVAMADWLLGRNQHAPPVLDARGWLHVDHAEDLPGICERMAGPLRMEVDGHELFGREPSLLLRLESAALQLAPLALAQSRLTPGSALRSYGEPVQVELTAGIGSERLSLEGLLSGRDGGQLELYGSAPRGFPRDDDTAATLILRVREFDLGPLLLQLPGGLTGSGILDGAAALTLHADGRKPRVDGELRLLDGTLGLSAIGQQLTDVTASLGFAEDRIEVRELSASDFDGRIALEGEMLWIDGSTLEHDLELKVEEFPVRREGRPLSHLTGEARVRGRSSLDATTLDMNVRSLVVRLPGDFSSDLMPLARHPDIVVEGERRVRRRGEAPYELDLHVVAPRFRVVRAELNAEMAAEIHARYVDPSLTLRGGAELRSGAFAMYGKRFRLERSRIAFDDSAELDPLVDLHATHKVGGHEVGVLVQGRLSDPIVTFTHTDPAVVEQSEILAELVAGRSAQPDRANEANQAAASFLAGATAGFLTEEVRDEMGVVPVIAVDQQDDQLSSTRIRAGLQLDAVIARHLGPLSGFVRGVYVEGFISPGADTHAQSEGLPTESRGGGLLELRFPRDVLGIFEYRPISNWRIDVAWEP